VNVPSVPRFPRFLSPGFPRFPHRFPRFLRFLKKIRTVFYLDKAERKTFDRLSKKTGAPLAELLRRAVALYLKAQKKKK
jgi:ribbon-helix-helix protein